jgi:phosphatidylinositol glycan class B
MPSPITSKHFLIRWLLISLGLHLVAAAFSTGYQNSDEHFQILEFLNTYLGGTPTSALPIEYGHLIRPWFQPFLYWVPVRLLMSLGINNPFTWAFAARLVSSLIGWLSVVGLALCVPLWIKQTRWQKWTIIALSLFWGLPALHARTSSENLSGALFVIGLCTATWLFQKRKSFSALLWLIPGALWGLAFEARYQLGFMVAGGFFWFVLIARLKMRDLTLFFAGILLAIGFGTYFDFLGYGKWTFAPWNYFYFNLVQDYVSSTDVSPWWDYFRRSWTESVPLLGFLTLIGLILFWIREPKHVLTWSLAPFFLVHLAIGHKETRFLFPLAHAAPVCVMILLFAQHKGRSMGEWMIAKRPFRWTLDGILFLNGIALVTLSLIPATPGMRFYKAVYDRSIQELYFTPGEDPYTLLGIPMYFYRRPNLKLLPLESTPPLRTFWYASRSAEIHADTSPELFHRCHAVTHSLPDLQVLERFRNWTLFECSQATQ